MSRIVYRHESVSRCVVGTVGVPGERAFFLQVASAQGENCVSVEKSQVMALVERIQEMIKELRRNHLASLDELGLPATKESSALTFPIEEDFRVGVIGISWLQDEQRILIEAQSIGDESLVELLDEDEVSFMEDAPDLLTISLRINQARGFCDAATAVVSAGRMQCPFCGLPIDPQGHLCPRANGYRR
jgi:uncharacterized repeat protein (TIGR03847 family)